LEIKKLFGKQRETSLFSQKRNEKRETSQSLLCFLDVAFAKSMTLKYINLDKNLTIFVFTTNIFW